jgi:hypothetical protein
VSDPMRVLLLNPPGKRTYIRDYFCSKTTKSNYLFHPVDLVVLSGTVGSEHEVAVLDAMAERLDPAAASARIAAFAPDVIVALVGSVSWDEDRVFLAGEARKGRRVVGIGDVLHEASEERMREEPWLDACLHVFANGDVLAWLRGVEGVEAPKVAVVGAGSRGGATAMSDETAAERGVELGSALASGDARPGSAPANRARDMDGNHAPVGAGTALGDDGLPAAWSAIEDMTVRGADGEPVRLLRLDRKKRKGGFRVPRPRHELFPEHGYRFSFARDGRFATVLSDYGCPYPCTFCVIGTLGFQTRPVEDVLEELDALRARGVHEVFFMDQTFGVVKGRGLELCAALAERGDLSWTAFTRPDTATDEMLGAMKAAGCHTVIMGVETGESELLAAYEKGYDVPEVEAAFARAKRHGLRTVGTFIIGLPEETEATLERTLNLALRLPLDFMSLNMAVPRFGTSFRGAALAMGLAEEGDLVMDQGGADAFLPTNTLDRATMLKLKKSLVRKFYLRPGYLWRRLKDVKSPRELGRQVREGLALLRINV